jgi:HD superfamily phosphohydrolase
LVINGPIDADRFDYLQRDSWHTGVPYTLSFDPERFINALSVEDRDGRSFELAVNEKAISSAEMFAVGRYFMYTSIYYHHTVRSFDRTLQEAVFKVTKKRKQRSIFSKLRNMTDVEFIKFIAERCESKRLSNAISKREYYKRLITLSEDDSEEYLKIFSKFDFPTRRRADDRLRDWINTETGCHFEDGEILIDLPSERADNTAIPLVSEKGTPIFRHSLFWRAITENFNTAARKLRVFASYLPDKWNNRMIENLRHYMSNLFKSLQK